MQTRKTNSEIPDKLTNSLHFLRLKGEFDELVSFSLTVLNLQPELAGARVKNRF